MTEANETGSNETASNETGSNEHGSKGRAQDVLGLALCAVGGFGAVSVLMQVLGNTEGKGALLGLFVGVQGLLGTFPTFVAMGGMAALGCLLFLRTEPLDVGRQLLGLLGRALGGALTLGGLAGGAGGAIGGALSDALQGSLAWLGALLSVVLGLAVLGTSAYLTWSERLQPFVEPAVERAQALAKGLRERAKTPSRPAPKRAADTSGASDVGGGVSADEAAALVPEAPRAPARREDPFHAPVTAGTTGNSPSRFSTSSMPRTTTSSISMRRGFRANRPAGSRTSTFIPMSRDRCASR